jgi:hypothetical protein
MNPGSGRALGWEKALPDITGKARGETRNMTYLLKKGRWIRVADLQNFPIMTRV